MKEITSKELFEVIEQPCLVDFYTENCPNCKTMEHVLEGLTTDIPIYKIKVDRESIMDIDKICNVMGAPTFIIFKDREVKFQKAGYIQGTELLDLIDLYK